jgi:hypothetical protein
VANYRFAAVRRLEEHVRGSKLDLATFPEIAEELKGLKAAGAKEE